MSHHRVVFVRAVVIVLFATGVASAAQQPPPPAVEHLPPEAHAAPALHPPRLVRPGVGLDRDMILRQSPRQHRSAELIIMERMMLQHL